MARNLDSSMAAALSSGLITPVFLISLDLPSGPANAWSGVGDFVWNGLTFKGVGNFGKISAIGESTDVEAAGISVQLAGVPYGDAASFVPDGDESTAATATITKSGQSFFGSDNSTAVMWSDFEMADALPPDAVIQAIYPVLVGTFAQNKCGLAQSFGAALSFDFGGALSGGTGGMSPSLGSSSTESHGGSVGTSLSDLAGQKIGVGLYVSGFNGTWTPADEIDITAVGFAVYYASATPSTSSLLPPPVTVPSGQGVACALPTSWAGYNPFSPPSTGGTIVATASQIGGSYLDIEQGSPAKLWFGLMADGALIGTPYLIFSGMVDQPTISIDESTIDYTLALESRMTNLQRPTARRYTAADQRLMYPDDIGFNWVEMLNDIALRWGT